MGTDGTATRRGPAPWAVITRPGRRGAKLQEHKQEVSFNDPGGSNSEDGDDLNTLVTMTKAEQLMTPGRGSGPRCWAQRGRAPRHPETQLAGIACPAMEQTEVGAKKEARKRRKLSVSSRMMGKV